LPVTHLTRRTAISIFAGTAAAHLLTRPLHAEIPPDWTTAIPPFRIAGNLYYVGSRDLASYLIATSAGHILINSNLATSPPQIKAAIEKLGFHYRDVKTLLISHAHYDHCAGSALILRETGAVYKVMEGDVDVVQSGGKADFYYGNDTSMHYPPARVNRILHDGSHVMLGDAVLTAHKTAGHTRGCTTWTMSLNDNGKRLNAVIVGSPNVNPGYALVGNKKYPEIAEDYAQGFKTLKSLPCDIFLGAHGGYFDLLEKLARVKPGSPNPFIDPAGYKNYVADREKAFEDELASQKAGHKPS
jgi:metallo-beta-lactamase class B